MSDLGLRSQGQIQDWGLSFGLVNKLSRRATYVWGWEVLNYKPANAARQGWPTNNVHSVDFLVEFSALST